MFRKTPGFRVFFWIFTVTIGGFIFLPLLWMINTALKPAAETFTLDFFTGTKTMENFAHIVTDGKIMRYLRNSLLVSFGSSLMATIVCAFAAYSFSKFRYRGRKLVMGLFMMSQAFPQAILLLSIYVLMQKTGLLGSYWALLISYVVFTLPVGTWTLKSYFDQLPDSLIEAAVIDGAGDLTIMRKIVMPLIRSPLATVAILSFSSAWTSVEASTYYIDNDSLKNFAFYVSTLSNASGNVVAGAGVSAAASLIMFLPSLILFIIMQSRVMNSMAHSGIK